MSINARNYQLFKRKSKNFVVHFQLLINYFNNLFFLIKNIGVYLYKLINLKHAIMRKFKFYLQNEKTAFTTELRTYTKLQAVKQILKDYPEHEILNIERI